ncbi:MAG: Mur ligase family protein [Suipraeoptans sp.]
MNKYDLNSYVRLLSEEGILDETNVTNSNGDTPVSDITYNSKEVKEGALFICKGISFKEEYLEEAIKSGAIGYVSEVKYREDIPFIITKDIRKAMPILSDKLFESPQSELKIIGIGGTKGKTTTSFYVKAIIDDYLKSIGEGECGILSSIITYDGINKEISHNTTPEAVELYRHLRNAADNNIRYMVMEVSSQALKYGRVDGLTFDVGVFLNISEDHISPIEHKDFEDYFNSKMIMFSNTKHAIVNMDIDYLDKVLEKARLSEDIHTFSTEDATADIYGYDISAKEGGSEFKVKSDLINESFALSMPGLFNVNNALAAISVVKLLGIPVKNMKEGLESARVTGRMEIFKSKDENLIAIVDYAHNKLSFESLFSSLKKEFKGYHITAVFGAPGGKAFDRREDLGSIAGKYADDIILTADEPGFEKVRDICEEIAVYVKRQGCPYKIIEDRGEALKAAVTEAGSRTLIVAAGKGHEGSQKVGSEYIDTPSDIEYMKNYIKEYDNRRD